MQVTKYVLNLCLSTSGCSPNEQAAVIAGIVALIALLVNVAVTIRNARMQISHQIKIHGLREQHEKDRLENSQIHSEEIAKKRQIHERLIQKLEHQHKAKMAELAQIHEQQMIVIQSDAAHIADEKKRFLEIRISLFRETIETQVKRLREIRRACHQSLRDIIELKTLSQHLDKDEMLVRSGSILRKALVILAPVDEKVPDLPEACYPPLASVRNALVKVILSWSADKVDRQPNSRLHLEMLDAIAEMQQACELFIRSAKYEEERILNGLVANRDGNAA